MQFELLPVACLLLCVAVFFDVAIRLRKMSLLKMCLLLIAVSLFVMNFYSLAGIDNRVEFVVVKSMRILYVCSTMLAIVHVVNLKIPRWIIAFIGVGFLFLVGLRIFYFDQINFQRNSIANEIFSIGAEFHQPHPIAKYTAYLLAALAVAITFFYYRRIVMKMNTENENYMRLRRWIICMVLPFFLLIIFGMLGNNNALPAQFSCYLFSFFTCTISATILLRPRFLNATSYVEACEKEKSSLIPG